MKKDMFGLRKRYRRWEKEYAQFDSNHYPGKALTPFKSRIVRSVESIKPFVVPGLALWAILAPPATYNIGSFSNYPREIHVGITDEFYLNFDGIPDAIVGLNSGKMIPFYGARATGGVNPKLKQIYLNNNPHSPESRFAYEDLVIRMLNGDRKASDELLNIVSLETRIEIFETMSARCAEIGEIKIAEYASRMTDIYKSILQKQQGKEQDK